MSLAVGDIVDGVVTGITNFGAFVEIKPGVVGLVHISEVAEAYVKNIADYLSEKDRVKVKVVNIEDNGKIGLSIKQANKQTKPKTSQPHVYASRKEDISDDSFEDKLSKFMKDSNEKLVTLKKHQEGRRGR